MNPHEASSQEVFKKQLNETLKTMGFEPCKLQAKWRPNGGAPFPSEFPWRELELALLDALVNEGGATAWSGDGSSCAVQIIHAIWLGARKEIEGRDLKIKVLKELLHEPPA